MVGVTGTNGKTTVTHLVQAVLRARRDRHRGDRHPGRGAHHPRGPRPPAPPGRVPRRGRRGGGHGGLVPRHDPAPGGRHRLRRGRLHQPEPGPSRPPRLHGGVLRGQGRAVRPGPGPGRGGGRGRPLGPPAGLGAGRSDPGPGAPRRGHRRGLAVGRTSFRVAAAGGWPWPSPGGSTWTTPWSPPRWPPPWAWTRTRWPRAWRAAGPVPGRMEVVATGGPVVGPRRLRPHPGRARGGADRGPRPGRIRAPDLPVRVRGRPRPGKASRDGRGVVTAGRRGRPDLGQPAVRGPAGHHRRDPVGPGSPGPRSWWSRTGPRPSGWPSGGPGPATWSCWPARGTRPPRPPADGPGRSTTVSRPDGPWRRLDSGGTPGVISLMTVGRRRPVGGRPVHAGADPVVDQEQHRPADPRGRPPGPYRQGRHPDHGRHRDRRRRGHRLPDRPRHTGGALLALGRS